MTPSHPSPEPAVEIPEHLTIAESVVFSRLSRSTLYNLIADKSLKSISLTREGKTRGRRFISRADLAHFIASHAA